MNKPLPYRLLVRLAPPSFRERHARAMDEQLRADLDEHLAGGGSRLAFWLAASATAARTLPSLWLASARRRRRHGSPDPRSEASLMDDLLQDFRYGLRGLAARPSATILCALALALGIGANATVFTFANEVFLKPLPVHEAHRLLDLHVEQPGANSFVGFSYPEFLDLQRAPAFAGISATSAMRLMLGDDPGTPIIGQLATAGHLPSVLGVELRTGRYFEDEDDVAGAPLVAVVSDGFWRRRMGASADAVGTTLRLDGHEFTVIGVLAPGFAGRFIGFPSEVWLPLHAIETLRPSARLDDRTAQDLELIGRMATGATVASARDSINGVARALEQAYPELNRDRRVRVSGYTGLDDSLRAGVLGFVGVLGTLAALVLAAACLNVGNLLLARGRARAAEISTRLALGGSRRRIVRQLVTETLMLFALGAGCAIALSLWIVRMMKALIGRSVIPLDLELAIDWRVLALTGAVALLTAVVTGLQPALRATRVPPADVLRSTRGSDPSDRRLRNVLVGAQVGVSVVLLLMAALFLRALQTGLAHDPGFPIEGLQAATIELDRSEHSMVEASQVLEAVAGAVRGAAPVEAAAMAVSLPIGVGRTPTPVTVPGLQPPPGQDAFFVDAHHVDGHYFDTVGIEILDGRPLQPADTADNRAVAVVNQAAAQLLWPGASPVNSELEVRGQRVTVVGLAADTLHIVQERTPGPLIFLPLAQHPGHRAFLLVRSRATPAALAAILEDAAEASTGAARLGNFRPQQRLIEDMLLPQRIAMRIAGGLGAVGLVLAITGVYGMVAFAVAARRREMGIRMALGAEPDRAVRMLLRSALVLVGAGALGGALASAALASFAGSFLEGVSAADPLAFAAVVTGTLVVAGVAAYLPARRAASIDPAATLRTE